MNKTLQEVLEQVQIESDSRYEEGYGSIFLTEKSIDRVKAEMADSVIKYIKEKEAKFEKIKKAFKDEIALLNKRAKEYQSPGTLEEIGTTCGPIQIFQIEGGIEVLEGRRNGKGKIAKSILVSELIKKQYE